MRAVLTFGLLLLALTLLLNAERGKRDRAALGATVEPKSLGEGATVRVFSTGALLTPERFERCVRAQEIAINGELFRFTTDRNGLRLASFFPDLPDVAYDNYDLANVDGDVDVDAFARRVRSAPVNTVMAMGVFRSIRPRGPGAARRLKIMHEVFAELGAACAPEDRARPSWAYVCIRRPQGWIPLAERVSETKGIMLAYNVSPDPTVYDDLPRPRAVVETWRKRTLASLYDWLVTPLDAFTAVRRGYGVSFEVNHEMRDGIMASPPFGPDTPGRDSNENRFLIPFLRLADAPRFEVQLGIESYHREACRGVEFEVRISEQIVATRRIAVDPLEPDAWIPWTIDLSAFANTWVQLDLRTRSLGLFEHEIGVWHEPAIWGDPKVIDYPTDERIASGRRDAMLDNFDQNLDDHIHPDEIRRVLLEYVDLDKDGVLTADEEPPEFSGLFNAMDADQNGAVDGSEIDAFYDQVDSWLR